MSNFISRPSMTVLLATVLLAIASALSAAEPVDYNREVRHILSDKCFRCHGPDERQRQADLRLDDVESATRTGDSGTTPIVPGKPQQSELVRRIFSDDPEERMPPPELKKTLSETEKETLKLWIQQGARYQILWSLVKPQRRSPHGTHNSAALGNEIDRFLLAQLEASQLRPSPQASRETLIRRLSFDLTGLPPKLTEIDDFLTDRNERAYEKLVDRLLASPHFGERMALDWMDASRFADTNGYHLDNGRDMSRWRKWVIDAFNRNLPFDQFTTEQLAGDLLPSPTLEQRIASGFNRNHMINFEGGAIPAEYHTAYIVDRVNTTATVWLGLTIGCAQCHDHKYDPVTQREFYQLFAFFHNVPENGLDGNQGNAMPLVRVPTAEQSAQLADFDRQISQLVTTSAGPLDYLDRAQRLWEQTQLGEQPGSSAPRELELEPWQTTGPMRHPEGGRRAYNKNLGPEGHQVDLQARYFLADTTYGWTRRDDWIDGQIIPLQGQQVATYLLRRIVSAQQRTVRVSLGSDDAVKVWLNQKLLVSSDATRRAAPDQHLVELPLRKGENELLLKVVNYFGDSAFYFALAPDAAGKTPDNVLSLIGISTDQRSEPQQRQLREYYRNNVANDPLWKKLTQRLAELRKQRGELEQTVPTSMVMQEQRQPRDTFVLLRGQYDKPGEKVSADVPASLPPLPVGAPRNRLGLARWLVSPEHPLMARVIVNRYWQMLFSTGLVATPEDFGTQGQPPSHPELLDWLAVEFQQSTQPALAGQAAGRWNIKALIKLMVMSAAYQRDARMTGELLKRDPNNRWLARGPRFRLSAEFIRDQALAVSGLLKHRLGGASVSPYQPAGLWQELSSRSDSSKWTAQVFAQSQGDDLYRRSMYTFWKRTCPPPTMTAFDAPDRETCTVRRARTNTPLQALILMNDPTYIEASRKMAERALVEGGQQDTDRIVFLFRLATGRRPSPQEQNVLLSIVEKQRNLFTSRNQAAARLLRVGESPCNPDLDPRELAAWTMLCSVILNLDETLTKG